MAGKEIEMENEEMNLAELLKDTAEENQTRKILAISMCGIKASG